MKILLVFLIFTFFANIFAGTLCIVTFLSGGSSIILLFCGITSFLTAGLLFRNVKEFM